MLTKVVTGQTKKNKQTESQEIFLKFAFHSARDSTQLKRILGSEFVIEFQNVSSIFFKKPTGGLNF